MGVTRGRAIERAEGRVVFGQDPAGYDYGRPGHPEELYDVLRERCGLGAGTRALEIGPGTGQATRRLLEVGASVLAVEPNEALAEYLRAHAGGSLEITVAPLEETPLPADAFDLALAASSFHWVEEDVGLARVLPALRPGGWWAMWWTLFGDDERPDPFREATDPILQGLASSPSGRASGRLRHGLDAEARLGALERTGFQGGAHELIRWSFEADSDRIRALYATFSPIARLGEPRRTDLLDEIARIARHEFGDHVTKPVLTSLFTARRPH